MEDCWIAGWLYEPGMEVALAISYSTVKPDYIQVVGITPSEYWSGGLFHKEKVLRYKDWLKKEARNATNSTTKRRSRKRATRR